MKLKSEKNHEKKSDSVLRSSLKKKLSKKEDNKHNNPDSGMNNILGKLSRISNSILFRLIISFLVPLIFIVALGLLSYNKSATSIVEVHSDSTRNLIESKADYFNVILESTKNKAIQLSVDNDAKEYYNETYPDDETQQTKLIEKFGKVVKNMKLTDKNIENIVVYTSYGRPVTTTGYFSDINHFDAISQTEEGKKINSNLGVIWSGYHDYIDKELKLDPNSYAISISKQYLNESNKPMGVIQIDISMGVITGAFDSMKLPEDSIVCFITPDGREIDLNGNREEKSFYGTDFYNEALAGTDAIGKSDRDINGKKHLYIYSKVGDTGAMVASLIPYSSLLSQAEGIKNMTGVVVLSAAVVAGLIGLLVSSGIGRAIKNIITTLAIATEGDLTVKVKTRRKDEFLVLSNSINHMIENMRKLIAKSSSVGNTVVVSSQNLTQNSELLLAASKDISSAVSEIQQGITQQASDAEQCLRQTDALAEQINLVYDNTMAVDKIASNTKSVVSNGINVVDKLNEATKENVRIIKDTIKDMEELENESNAITSVIAVINEIASQTNLLSLNASIEAARAGAAGKGFSVVAEEIRKLSERSVKAASEIENIIIGIISKTKDTVQTVKQEEKITQTTEERLNEVVKLFHNINIHVDELAVKMNRITEGIGDIERAKNDTLHAIENISAVAEETSASSQEVDATAQQQLEAVTKLNEDVKALEKEAADLAETIVLFKTE